MANAFDKLAGKPKPASSKSTVKVSAEVNDEIKLLVDAFINIKAIIKEQESQKKDTQEQIITVVRDQIDKRAFAGDYTSSMYVPGKNTPGVTLITTDSFTVPQDDSTLDELKVLLGKSYDDLFAVRRTIALKKEVIENEDILNTICSACEKAGLDIGSIFDVADKVCAKDDLAKNQYKLGEKKLAQFRSLVRQKAAYLK